MQRNTCWLAVSIGLLGLLVCFGCGIGPAEETLPSAPTDEATVSVEPTAPPTATPEPLQATIRDVINEVLAAPFEDGEEQAAEIDMVIYLGGHVRAEAASTARVQVDVEKLIRVAPNTVFTLEQLDPDALKIDLTKGQMWLNVEGLDEGDAVEVETPSAVAAVRGTLWSARVVSESVSIFSTRAGTITVSSKAGGAVDVGPGYQTAVSSGAAPSVPEPMRPEEQMRWGLAAGDLLDVVLPATDGVGGYAYEGVPLSRDWSVDGRYFAHSYVDTQAREVKHVFYDTQSGGPVASSLPSGAGGIFFSPGGGEFSFQYPEGGNTSICTAPYPSALSSSARAACMGPACEVSFSMPLEAGLAPFICFGGDATYGWPFWSPDGERIAFYSNRDTASAFVPRSTGRDLRVALHEVRQADAAFHLYTARPDGSDMTRLTSEGGYNIRHAWSPDGEWIAFVRTDAYEGPGDVWVMRADGTNARRVFEGIYGDGFSHLAWSPDGQLLAVPAKGGGLWIVSVATPGLEDDWMVPGTEDILCESPVWLSTGDGWPLVFGGYHETLQVEGTWAYLPDVTDVPWRLADPGWGLSWAPDGGGVAAGIVEPGRSEQLNVVVFKTTLDLYGEE